MITNTAKMDVLYTAVTTYAAVEMPMDFCVLARSYREGMNRIAFPYVDQYKYHANCVDEVLEFAKRHPQIAVEPTRWVCSDVPSGTLADLLSEDYMINLTNQSIKEWHQYKQDYPSFKSRVPIFEEEHAYVKRSLPLVLFDQIASQSATNFFPYPGFSLYGIFFDSGQVEFVEDPGGDSYVYAIISSEIAQNSLFQAKTFELKFAGKIIE